MLTPAKARPGYIRILGHSLDPHMGGEDPIYLSCTCCHGEYVLAGKEI